MCQGSKGIKLLRCPKRKMAKKKNHLPLTFYLKIVRLSDTCQQTGSLFVSVSKDVSEFFIRSKVTQIAKNISSASTVESRTDRKHPFPFLTSQWIYSFWRRVTLGQGWLHGHETCAVTQSLCSDGPCPWFNILRSCVLKFLMFEQGAMHFHLVLDPTNYVVGPAWEHSGAGRLGILSTLPLTCSAMEKLLNS